MKVLSLDFPGAQAMMWKGSSHFFFLINIAQNLARYEHSFSLSTQIFGLIDLTT